ncbi:unnamed protein product [Caenorhabditis angaria]|uniref:Uncharacterized protein n=1 Tax=Caenorhabditis angaria TaxID=860376 RepID=A0A9P1NA54_9PELO|nr:unnamed protein product [Caenorhabditis angaria]
MVHFLGVLLIIVVGFVENDPVFLTTNTDICLEPVDPGPCQYYAVQWFWDQQDEECKEFHYGGCMGTKNRFATKQQCIKQCRYKMFNPIAIPDLCLLDVDQGHCGDERRGHYWYFFNSESGLCEQFFYYGCGGNDNKFYSLYQCRKVCGERLSPQIACEHCNAQTSFCKSHSKFNWTCECRVGFEKNQYGECVDIDECRGYTAVCDRNAWCTNEVGSYNCECMASYRGDGKHCTYVGLGRSSIDCKDCSTHATCVSGVCQCKEGYEGDGFNCTDVNECLRRPEACDKNAECINRDGSFICTCLPGFAGNGYNCTVSKNSCLDKFDHDYKDTCSNENWRPHYYYNHETRNCEQFWYDGCAGRSRNIFSEYETCTSFCEETNVLTRAGELPEFSDDPTCVCFFFAVSGAKHQSGVCWHLSGHHRNGDEKEMSPRKTTTIIIIVTLLISNIFSRSEVCWDKFDMNYRNQCLHGHWEQRYYFDHASLTCRQFWFDGCRSDSRNIFDDHLTCQWLCESQPMYKSRSCLEDFDPALRGECNGGRWRHQWYFDKNTKKCYPFWYDGCKGSNENIFQDEMSCLVTCENPAKKDPKKPWHNNDKHKMKEILSESVYKPNLTDVCATDDPCENGGICIFVWKKNTHYCKCPAGYNGNNCENLIEFDPCAEKPCLNGGSCQAKYKEDAADEDKPEFECFCTPGYAGLKCEERPCETNPCLNNGTCRTTKGVSHFFCDCSDGYGGKNCDIKLGDTQPSETYGKNVEQISSGKIEWINELKKKMEAQSGGIGGANGGGLGATGGKSGEKSKSKTKKVTTQVADEPYKDPATRKKEREEREKKEAEEAEEAAEKLAQQKLEEEKREAKKLADLEKKEEVAGKFLVFRSLDSRRRF